MAQTQAAPGFTLIEVLIALAIVAITTTVAVASYRGHVVRSRRVEAVQALLAAAAEQEKFHLAHGYYGNRLDAAVGDELPGLPVASRTPGGHYALTVATANASDYRVVATATSDRADPACRRLSIDESGRREAADSRGSDSTRRCW